MASTERVMDLIKILGKHLNRGSLTIIDAAGCSHRLLGSSPGPEVAVRFDDPAVPRQLIADPDNALGDLYMDGAIRIERGSVRALLDLLMGMPRPPGLTRARGRGWFRRSRRTGPIRPRHARANANHHDDLPDALFDLFLDRDLHYSCAYFADPRADLEQAQQAKLDHLAAKLRLKPDQAVLDIACGWGGLALALAREGARVTGISLSDRQLERSRLRAASTGLDQRVRFERQDYRAVDGQFDRIVSVGMFEHVGPANYDSYFGKLSQLLAHDGVALVQTIGRLGGPGDTHPWIDRHIFPGGYCPALSEIVPAIERAGLLIADLEVLRGHYALTLERWQERFHHNREAAETLMGERFCRMWEFYLAASEMAFRHQQFAVFQFQLCRHVDSLPLTRDYMVDDDRARRCPGAPPSERHAAAMP
ncbi:MAG: class I SAM-dependent methyltransferase [Rhodothalassiaceae bacterium]